MDVDPKTEAQNLTQKLGLGALQQINGEEDKRNESDEPRTQVEV
jgi:hypothetical protein